jgi:hypothetical protein
MGEENQEGESMERAGRGGDEHESREREACVCVCVCVCVAEVEGGNDEPKSRGAAPIGHIVWCCCCVRL